MYALLSYICTPYVLSSSRNAVNFVPSSTSLYLVDPPNTNRLSTRRGQYSTNVFSSFSVKKRPVPPKAQRGLFLWALSARTGNIYMYIYWMYALLTHICSYVTYTCIYTIHTCMRVYTDVCICMQLLAGKNMYIHTCTHTCTYTHAHTYIIVSHLL